MSESSPKADFDRERAIFLSALEKPSGAARENYLKEACAGEPGLRAAVDGLLASHTEDSFLEGGARVDLDSDELEEGKGAEGAGDQIGRFKLLERIGEGGFGVVYMAEQREPVKRRVALKIIKLGMDTEKVVARFEAERQALALMEHTNIARVLDGGVTDTGRPYFVMELVRGTPITKFCDQNQLGMRERLKLFISVCQAIQHAHQKGIVHRDIKPSNVMVMMHDDRPVVKVIDFGIAKAMQHDLTDKTVFTKFHEFLGTPAYMSPEQAGQSGVDIDTRSDVYSLGVLLYEMLTGLTPLSPSQLQTNDYEEIRRQIRELEAPRPSTRLSGVGQQDATTIARQRRSDPVRLRRQLKGDLDWIILKALEKDRTRRYETATALADDINRYLRNEPVTAVAPNVGYLLSKYARRHRVGLGVAATLAVTLIVSAVYSADQASKASAASELARTNLGTAIEERKNALKYSEDLDDANGELTRTLTRTQFAVGVNHLQNDEKGRGIAFLADALRRDPTYWPAATHLVSTLTDRGSLFVDQPRMEHETSMTDCEVNRDTGLMVTRDTEGGVRIWEGWESRLLLDFPPLGGEALPQLSPDGRELVLITTNGVAQVYAPLTGEAQPRLILPVKDSSATLAVMNAASASQPLIATWHEDHSIRVWDARNGNPLRVVGEMDEAGELFSFTSDGCTLLASFSDGSVVGWTDFDDRVRSFRLRLEPNSIVRLSPDSQTLVERAEDSEWIRFWDLQTAEPKGEPIRLKTALAPIEDSRWTDGQDFEFSSDGRYMVAWSHGALTWSIRHIDEATVSWFDTREGRLLQSISQPRVTAYEVNVPSGFCSMVLDDNHLVVHSLKSGAKLVDVIWPSDSIQQTRFSPSGERILVALANRTLQMLDARTGEKLTNEGHGVHLSSTVGEVGKADHQTYSMEHRHRLAGIEFSPEGDIFVTRYRGESLQLWDADDGKPLTDIIAKLGSPLPVTFSADGQRILSRINFGYDDWKATVQVLPRDLRVARHAAIPDRRRIKALRMSGDGKWGMAGRTDLTLFDAESGEVVRVIPSDGLTAKGGGSSTWLEVEVYFTPDGSKIVGYWTGPGEQRFVRVIDPNTGEELNRFPGDWTYSLKPVGNQRFLTQLWEGQLRLHSIETGEILVEIPKMGGGFSAASNDGKRIAITGGGPGIHLLNGETLESVCPPLWRDRLGAIRSIAFSPDNKRLVTGSKDNSIRVWNADTGELEAEMNNHGWPRWAEFSPDSQLVVSGAGRYDVENPVFVWRIDSQQPRLIAGPMIEADAIYHATFSPDNSAILVGDRKGYAILWDIETGLPMMEPMVHPGGVTRVSFNRQMSRVYSIPHGSTPMMHRPLPPKGESVPEWLPVLAEAIGGMRVNGTGGIETVNWDALRQVRDEIWQSSVTKDGEGFYSEWAEWMLSKRQDRTVAPFSKVTAKSRTDQLIAKGSLKDLRQAARWDPGRAEVSAALALRLGSLGSVLDEDRLATVVQTPEEYYARLALRQAPDSITSQWVLGEVLLLNGKLAEAREWISANLAGDLGNANVLAVRAELARLEGDRARGEALMEAALQAPISQEPLQSSFLSPNHYAGVFDQFEVASLRTRAERGLAGRSRSVDRHLLDLTPYYNEKADELLRANLDESASQTGSEWWYQGIPFDVRGTVHLSRSIAHSHNGVPAIIREIPVNQTVSMVHVLTANDFVRDNGKLLLTLHYQDGQSRELVAGTSGGQLILNSLANPRTEVPVESLSLRSEGRRDVSLLGVSLQEFSFPKPEELPKHAGFQAGQAAVFRLGIADPENYRFQWLANGEPIEGATGLALTVPDPETRVTTRYQVRVLPRESDPAFREFLSPDVFLYEESSRIMSGVVKEELFLNGPTEAVAIADLPAAVARKGEPSQVSLRTALSFPNVKESYFLRRLSGWFDSEETGEYIFSLSANDVGAVYLSPNERVEDLRLIAWTPSVNGEAQAWSSIDGDAESEPIRLEKGKRYAFKVLHQELYWGSHLYVTWRKRGEPRLPDGTPAIGGKLISSRLD